MSTISRQRRQPSLEVEMRARFALQDASRDEASSAQTAAVQEVGALFGDTCGKFHDSPLFIWFQVRSSRIRPSRPIS